MRLGTLRWRQNGDIRSVAFLADGKGVLTAGQDGNLRIWDLATGNVQRQFREYELTTLSRAWIAVEIIPP